MKALQLNTETADIWMVQELILQWDANILAELYSIVKLLLATMMNGNSVEIMINLNYLMVKVYHL